MNNRRGIVVSLLLVAFTIMVIAWQSWPDDTRRHPESSLAACNIRGKLMAGTSDIINRDNMSTPADGWSRQLDLQMPENARVFMTDMTGPTNYSKIGFYFYATYYLFPREVDVSLDPPTHLMPNGLTGQTTTSDQELLAHGFDIRLDNPPGTFLAVKALHPLDVKAPQTPEWFNSFFDRTIAFLLPLVTALAGMTLLRFLVPDLVGRMTLFDRLACSFGLGMMIVAAVTLGVKLCGLSGYGLILALTYLGALAEIWRHRQQYKFQGVSKVLRRPGNLILFTVGVLVFIVLFRLAGLAGLTDPDSLRWMLKAKIMHLYAGSDLIHWFSNPAFSHAHLDYPALVPSLHAATFDSLGHVDEFVTKFWPVWMLFFLVTALASLVCDSKKHFSLPLLAPLCLLLLPATQQFVQWEGSTMPMTFFTALGCLQCCLWMVGQDRNRLMLGLALLFGAAMVTYQGFIALALAIGGFLLLPSLRRSLMPMLTLLTLPRLWKLAAFCLASVLPFIVLRLEIPVVNYESGWTHYAVQHPAATLSAWPGIALIELGRMFMDPDFIQWSGVDGHFQWTGHWSGLSSLYNHTTLGLGWVCLALTLLLWITLPARRAVALWISAIFIGTLLILSAVFASFVTVVGLDDSIRYTAEAAAGRYLFPILVAWFAMMIVLLFNEPADLAAQAPAESAVPALENSI